MATAQASIPDPYAPQLADPYAAPKLSDPYSSEPPGTTHGHLTYQQLKDSWIKHGGDPGHADIMAHVFMAESGDGKTYADPNANADHHTHYVENGKTYYPEGLGQISTIHGLKNMFDPDANMREAVSLFRAQGFGPWKASRKGGAGGGWGQYLEPHNHPDNAVAKLPAGGFAKVIGAQHIGQPQLAGVVPTGAVASWGERLADTVEGAVRSIEGALSESPGGTQGGQYAGKTPKQIADPYSGANKDPETPLIQKLIPGYGGATSKLSKSLSRLGEAADVPTFDLANVIARAVGGDRSALGDFMRTISPKAPAGQTRLQKLEQFESGMNPFHLNGTTPEDLGAALDHLGQYGFNSPQDIAYWEGQPGVRARIVDAKPKTLLGHMTQVALGMHADLARLKPGHPYATGLETATGEYFNPSYIAMGAIGGATTGAVMRQLHEARVGKFGPNTQRLANLAADSPLIGNRFTKMGDAFGPRGETWHYRLARDLHNVPYESQARFTSDDTFGHAGIEDQIRVVKQLQNDVTNDIEYGLGSQPDPAIAARMAAKMVGNATLGDRAHAIGQLIDGRDNELRAIDPAMANRLMTDGYFSQQGAWDLPGQRVTDPRYPQGVPSLNNAGRGAGSPVSNQRVFESLSQGQREGMDFAKSYVPAGAAAMHDAVISRYIVLAKYMKQLEQINTTSGKPGMFDVDYDYRTPNGNILQFGKGAAGYDRTQEFAAQQGAQRAQMNGIARGWNDKKIADMSAHYKNVVLKDIEDQFRQKNPNYTWNAEDALQMPMLKGKAVENAAIDAAIDAHPTLGRMQKGGFEKYQLHTIPEEPVPGPMAWLDNLNSLVRQGILSNVIYHPLFNLAPMALGEGVNPYWIARALAIDPKGVMIPKAWMDRAWKYQAVAPKFGSALQINPMERARIMTVPYGQLKPHEIAMKAINQGSKWNQDITFGYFEDRLAAVTMRHYETKMHMTPEAAARATRKIFGDYENMTQAERNAGIFNWHYFYSWMRGQLRYWGQTFATHPQKIMAPVAGVQTANQMQGDQGNIPGSGLSLRSAFNALHYGWGTDAHGNPRYVALPFPNFRYGSDVARAAGSATLGDPNELPEVGFHLATTSLPPLPGFLTKLGLTAALPAGQPEPWNDLLWDKNAPTRGEMMRQAAGQLADAYAPPPIRGTAEAIAQKDPTQAISAVGPYVYSAPNTSPQSKAAYAMSQDLRGLLRQAEKNNDTYAATEIYDLMQRVDDGDPLAVIRARATMKALRAEVGLPYRRRFGPRF